jgi:GntR family transcriptional regulator
VFPIDASDPTPLYAQLERAIRVAIATGRLRAGERLPTVRQLAVDLRINANTVAKVYGELERNGVLETRRGVGTFIQDVGSLAASLPDRERQLMVLADRYLTGAAALGFSAAEAVARLKARKLDWKPEESDG